MRSKFLKIVSMLLIVITMLTTLCACGMFDKPIMVSFIDETGEQVTQVQVSLLSKALVPELNRVFAYDKVEIPADGAQCRSFRGWSFNPDAINPELATTIKSNVQPNNTLSYDQIKDHIVDGKVTMYAVWAPYADLVIGWDARSISGLTDEIIENFKVSVRNFLDANGYSYVSVDYKKFDQETTADLGAAVTKNGSINVLIGVGSNINLNPGGKVTVMKLVGGIPMGGKVRYIARLDNKDLSILIYDWLQTSQGQEGLKK